MPTLTIAGVPHFYQEVGLAAGSTAPAPPTLVFVHGWLLSHHYWTPLMQNLADDYACVGYDLRGFGASIAPAIETSFSPTADTTDFPPDQQQFDLVSYAQDLITLLDKLNIDQAWLVGHSLGGSIAIWAAHLCPERIKGVTCLNAGGGIYIKADFDRFRAAGEQLVNFRPGWIKQLPLMDLVFSRLMVNRPLERQWGRQRLLDLLRADATAARGSLLESTTETEVLKLPQLVAELKQPLYFLAGQQDNVMELKYVNYLASFHPLFYPLGENVVCLEQCGHFAMLEQLPGVTETLRQILNTAKF